MPNAERVQALIALAEQLRIEEAVQQFYADDVVMQENGNPPTVGKAANLDRERAFWGAITVYDFRALSFVVSGDRAVINWLLEFAGPDGKRSRVDQLAYQTWRGDRVAHERFFYDTASLAVDAAA